MAIFLFFLSIIRHLFRSHTPPTPSPSEIVVSYFKWSSRPLRFTFKHGMFTVFLWQPRVSLLPRVYSACGRSLKLRCCHARFFQPSIAFCSPCSDTWSPCLSMQGPTWSVLLTFSHLPLFTELPSHDPLPVPGDTEPFPPWGSLYWLFPLPGVFLSWISHGRWFLLIHVSTQILPLQPGFLCHHIWKWPLSQVLPVPSSRFLVTVPSITIWTFLIYLGVCCLCLGDIYWTNELPQE